MVLTPAERQRRYRIRRDADKNRTQANLRKDIERQYKYRRLIKSMFKRQSILARRKWRRSKYEKRRKKKLEQMAEILPPPSPSTDSTLSYSPGYAENCL